MPTEGPPPIVPRLQSNEELPETQPDLARADGGSRASETPVDRPFGAPLVPEF